MRSDTDVVNYVTVHCSNPRTNSTGATKPQPALATEPMTALAEFNMDGVSGTISFRQRLGGGPTKVMIALNGLKSTAGKYHVHLRRINESSSDGKCSPASVGGHFNPLGVDYGTATCNATKPETCEIGDLR